MGRKRKTAMLPNERISISYEWPEDVAEEQRPSLALVSSYLSFTEVLVHTGIYDYYLDKIQGCYSSSFHLYLLTQFIMSFPSYSFISSGLFCAKAAASGEYDDPEIAIAPLRSHALAAPYIC